MHESLDLSPDSLVVAAGRPDRERDAPVNPSVVLSSTFIGTGPLGAGDRGYGRYANPTWEPFEDVLGRLEGSAEPALLFSSGLAAVSAALSLVPLGGVVVMPGHSYAGTVQMATELAEKGLFTLRLVDIADTDAVLRALTAEDHAADLLWLESPTNPMLGVADLPVLIAAGQEQGALVVVDNTFCTPLVQQPLLLGADLVLHSVTKYLAGHSDVVLGALVARDVSLRDTLLHHRALHGSIAGPWEAWLALRGLRTLALRVERSQASAQILAERLAANPAVDRVRFPGLPQDPGHARAAAQLKGFGSILAIEVGASGSRSGAENADALVRALRLWVPATSLGGVESLIERRRRHAAEPVSVPDNLVRLSVGIESVDDLWADLTQALDTLPSLGR